MSIRSNKHLQGFSDDFYFPSPNHGRYRASRHIALDTSSVYGSPVSTKTVKRPVCNEVESNLESFQHQNIKKLCNMTDNVSHKESYLTPRSQYTKMTQSAENSQKISRQRMYASCFDLLVNKKDLQDSGKVSEEDNVDKNFSVPKTKKAYQTRPNNHEKFKPPNSKTNRSFNWKELSDIKLSSLSKENVTYFSHLLIASADSFLRNDAKPLSKVSSKSSHTSSSESKARSKLESSSQMSLFLLPCIRRNQANLRQRTGDEIFQKRIRSKKILKSHLTVSWDAEEIIFPPYYLSEATCKDVKMSARSWKKRVPRTGFIRLILEQTEEGDTDVLNEDEFYGWKRMDHRPIAPQSMEEMGISETLLKEATECLLVFECKVKGYEMMCPIERGRKQDGCQLLIASNRNNGHFPAVEVAMYRRSNAYHTAAMLANTKHSADKGSSFNHPIMIPPHDNLVKLLHRFNTPSRIFQVCEHLSWPSLADLIDIDCLRSRSGMGHFEENACRTIFRQMCWGLRHLHSFSVLHGDLACYNVLVTDKWEVKLCGYGPSCQRMFQDNSCPVYDEYLPPELRSRAQTWDKTSDVWCLGVCLLEMILGYVPHCFTAPVPARNLGTRCLHGENYQLCLLLDSVLKPMPSERPTVDIILNHPWLAAEDIACDSSLAETPVKTSFRADGKCFPLPKRIQRTKDPEHYYEFTDASTDRSDNDSEDTPVGSPRSPKRLCSNILCAGKSSNTLCAGKSSNTLCAGKSSNTLCAGKDDEMRSSSQQSPCESDHGVEYSPPVSSNQSDTNSVDSANHDAQLNDDPT